MVVFTCNYCGDSLQKPKVEKHYTFVCRKVKNLTCVDCFKDFRGEDYAVHIKCCTEEERYAAKGAHPNGIVKKGDVKQESWLSQVRSIIDKETHLKPNQKSLLSAISQYDNIPRKKKKFINFLINSMGRRINVSDIEAAWDLIEKHTNGRAAKQVPTNEAIHKEDNTEECNKECKSDPTDDKQVDTKKKKRKRQVENESASNDIDVDQKNKESIEIPQNIKKKRKNKIESKESDLLETPTKIKETEECQNGNTHIEGSTFNIKETAVSILERKGCITLKKLEKKVLAEYRKHNESGDSDRIVKKLHKKIDKMPFKVVENMVSLSTLTQAEQ